MIKIVTHQIILLLKTEYCIFSDKGGTSSCNSSHWKQSCLLQLLVLWGPRHSIWPQRTSLFQELLYSRSCWFRLRRWDVPLRGILRFNFCIGSLKFMPVSPWLRWILLVKGSLFYYPVPFCLFFFCSSTVLTSV